MVGSAALDLLNMWRLFGFGCLSNLFSTRTKVRLKSRFVTVTLV